jgi:hypothetical protein
MGKNQADVELIPAANGTGTATVHVEPATLLCVPHVQQLVFREHWFRDSPLAISVCTLPHSLFMHFSVFRSLPFKGEQYWFPRCSDQWCEMCVGSEVYAGGTCPCRTSQLLHHYHRFCWELSA